ncbi:MAG: 2-isopropylmalate synthase [Myxococcales bacterium]|nr:2-isopropylmalate synthase [Myxococcales bacterium]
MARPDESELIYDWNTRRRRWKLAERPIEFHDETLRDGLQGPSIVDPPIEAKLRILELADALGIHSSDVGLPGAGPRAVEDVTALCQHIVDQKLSIRPTCAARTHINDLKPIAEISQKVGLPIEVMCFLGTSPIRSYAEAWDQERLIKLSIEAVEFCNRENLPVNFVTEDTVRSRPATLHAIFTAVIERGAQRLTLCDTVGHATPDGVNNLIQWTRNLIEGTGRDVKIDWHGHNDRGLGVVNSIYAIECGADRVHGTALGIGERVGNAALDQILLNFKLLGEIDNDLTKLTLWCHAVSQAMHWDIPRNYPLLGDDAFRTATGVHAAAVIKAHRKGDDWLADRIYSGVPAGLFGKRQVIEIGHMSGLSNVLQWLEVRHIEPREGLAESILEAAKRRNRVLSSEEVHDLIAEFP